MASQLPSLRVFLANLISALPLGGSKSQDQNQNPLNDLDQQHRNLLLTLHVLFPTQLLPALDLLDRGLVTRFVIRAQPPIASETTPPLDESAAAAVYYVRSAQHGRSSNNRLNQASSDSAGPSYEVRLDAWNCSCPAFAFAAFPPTLEDATPASATPRSNAASAFLCSLGSGGAPGSGRRGDTLSSLSSAWSFGGATRGEEMPPVCKHLLACVMVEKSTGLFGRFAGEKIVSVEEAAGWAADGAG